MAHFDVDFLDKNSERYMLSRRIRKITDVIKSDFFIKDSVSTGDFFIRDGQYTFNERNEGEWKPFKANCDYWGYHECYCWFKQNIKNPESITAKSVKMLNAQHKLALSGTPIENKCKCCSILKYYKYL